jgi:dihydrodipicolinate synthase/N-acetylneuraminate lyase
MLGACLAKEWARAHTLWAAFKPLEDLRDAWGPARVLHHATELAGIARTGPIPPFVSPLDGQKLETLATVARALKENDA